MAGSSESFDATIARQRPLDPSAVVEVIAMAATEVDAAAPSAIVLAFDRDGDRVVARRHPATTTRELAQAAYAALTGEAPEDGGDSAVAPIQRAAPWVGPELARVIHAALVDPPAHAEFARALAFARDLELGPAAPLLRARLIPVPAAARLVEAASAEPLPASWSALVTAQRDAGAHPYELLEVLGEGAMGIVRRARGPAGDVAIKTLHPSVLATVPDVVERFLREARALARIDSSFVVRVERSGLHRGQPYLAMELLRGADLGAFARAHGPLAAPVAAQVIARACRGLEAAHASGVVHRDVKPSNLFLHETEGELVVKLCDFGIARTPTHDARPGPTALTGTGDVLGSPAYMAPEQLHDPRSVTARADIFGLGVVAFELVTGRRPWPPRANATELVLAICTKDAPDVRRFAPKVSPALAAVIGRCLARDPAARFPSASALRETIERLEGPIAEPLTWDTLRGPTPESPTAGEA